jgi:hypothetical protein
MMLKILIYAYATGTFSSRKIARALHESIPYIYLSGWQTPDFRTISEFRKNNLEKFKALFKQVVELCNRLNMVKLGHIAIDGAKIKASASGSKTYDKKRIEKEIEKLIKEAKSADDKEDILYGTDCSGDEVPEGIRKQKDRIKKLQELKEELSSSGKEKINRADPDASFMKTTSGIKTSFNAQAALDKECMVITANDVVNEASDVNQLEEKEIDAYIPDREYQSNIRKGKDLKENRFHKENFSYNETHMTFGHKGG